MPIFEYQCIKCGNKFEFLTIPGKEEAPVCPSCGSGDIKKELPLFKSGKRSGNGPAGAGTCCGTQTPCDNPKRCCGA
ncbi:MAG: zinc ribbon domain-containing protein [Elusimicrobia bacterium]|nr:zinc ribbon domain-containing protein [Elusimicrobiota bacterium]